jgi:hypothetical protein
LFILFSFSLVLLFKFKQGLESQQQQQQLAKHYCRVRQKGCPFFEKRGGTPPHAGFGAPLLRSSGGAEAPPASHSVQEVPADERRAAATSLRVRVDGGGGGGGGGMVLEKGGGLRWVFKWCQKKNLF